LSSPDRCEPTEANELLPSSGTGLAMDVQDSGDRTNPLLMSFYLMVSS